MLGATGATTTPPRSSPDPPLNRAAAAFGPSAYTHQGGRASYAGGVPQAWDVEADTEGVLTSIFDLARTVYHGTACDLPGVTIPYDTFVPAMWRAVSAGYVSEFHGELVHQGLRWGFEAGLSPSSLRGIRVFKNYDSATGVYRSRVTQATEARVQAGRTLDLGEWSQPTGALLSAVFGSFFIFPMGATAKPLEPDKARPTDDHTRTGLNAATDMTYLAHSVRTVTEIARLFLRGCAMHVTDVQDAFLMLPWAPWLWPYFFHRFHSSEGTFNLYMHVNGDFGTRGFPGVFNPTSALIP